MSNQQSPELQPTMVEPSLKSRDIGLVLVHKVLDCPHLHYGYWPAKKEARLGDLYKAQERYSEHAGRSDHPTDRGPQTGAGA